MPLSCQKGCGGEIRKCVRCNYIFCSNCDKSGVRCPMCGDNSNSV